MQYTTRSEGVEVPHLCKAENCLVHVGTSTAELILERACRHTKWTEEEAMCGVGGLSDPKRGGERIESSQRG